jgi:SAM-dependent methyltransferase
MPSPFEWSSEMDNIIWNNVGKLVLDDPRTDWSENLSLGYPFEVIREQVLAKGLADFGRGHSHPEYGELTADDKALLFCFVNLKKHFFACLATYEAHRGLIEELFAPGGRAIVTDIGCGPGTACLALAELLPGKRFDYLGIDSAPAMRSKARVLWEAALTQRLIAKESTADLKASWSDVAGDAIEPATSVMAIFSYFFASQSLTLGAIRSLAGFIRSRMENPAVKLLITVYLNSTNPLANRNYEVFKQLLGLDPEMTSLTQLTIAFRKKKGGAVAGMEEFIQEVLRLKGA